MNSLNKLPPIQVKWIVLCVSRCAYVVWPALAAIVGLSDYNQSPSSKHLAWGGVALLFAWGIHFVSRRSIEPYKVIQYELLIASFILGLLIGMVNLQALPSLAIFTSISAFILVGGLAYFLISILFCLLGFATYSFTVGINFSVTADFHLNLLAMGVIILFQAVFAVLALTYYDMIESEQDKHDNLDFIDSSTGLKTIHYFNSLVEKNKFHFLSREKIKQDKKVSLSLYLIRIDLFEQICQGKSQEFSNKLVSEFAYVLFDLIKSNDLVLRWQDDQLLLISEREDGVETSELAQTIVSRMHSHPIIGVELTISVVCTSFTLRSSKIDKHFWYAKTDRCVQAMDQLTSLDSWQLLDD